MSFSQPKPLGPWSQTGLGFAVDLISPTPAMIDLYTDVAESLARLPRFCGHVRSGPYSVAQHCVIGADALFRETGRADIAAAFLLHDAHEYVLNDIPTPVATALAVTCGNIMAKSGDQWRETGERLMKVSIAKLKSNLDKAIYGAAGITLPLPAEIASAVATMDLRMLATERRYILGPSPFPWSPAAEEAIPLRLVGRLRVWPWPEAANEFINRLDRYLPQPHGTGKRPRPGHPTNSMRRHRGGKVKLNVLTKPKSPEPIQQ